MLPVQMDHSTKSSLRGLHLTDNFNGLRLIKRSFDYQHGGLLYTEKPKHEPMLNPAVNLLINTQFCARFISKGYCNKKDCTFAHSEEELQPLPDLTRTKWCRLVFHGLVCHDEHCPYAHAKEQLRSNAQDLISYKTSYCKYYLGGNCLSGINCRFAHSPFELRDPTDHPRCVQVREQLKQRNRDIQQRRQQVRKERQALISLPIDEDSSSQVEAYNELLHRPPPGFPSLASGSNRSTSETEGNANNTRPFLHTTRSSLDSNLSGAYLHAGQRAKGEEEQRAEGETHLSRVSTLECLHATAEGIVGKDDIKENE